MNVFCALVRRNLKLFFKDKGMFFTSLITPLILLVLYATFLGKVYRDTFSSALPEALSLSEEVLNGCVGGQLISSILAVCCVTVAFCSNMLMVQDKANGTVGDLTVTPLRGSTLAFSYHIAAYLATLIICFCALAVCMIYIAFVGWYLNVWDILLLCGDILLLSLFGTTLSGIIGTFLHTQGQISAVGTIVSSGYGFICGAYMPISQFAEGLQRVISFLPGTYGTSLVRNHAMRGSYAEMAAQGVPTDAIESIRDAIDCNLYFFDKSVPQWAMYGVLGGITLLLLALYLWLNRKNKVKV